MSEWGHVLGQTYPFEALLRVGGYHRGKWVNSVSAKTATVAAMDRNPDKTHTLLARIW